MAWLVTTAVRLTAQKPVISDDFETGKLDTGKWEVRTLLADTKIQMTVVEGDAAHGRYALRLHYPAGSEHSGYACIVAKNLPESVRGHLFGRAYVKIPSELPLAHTQMIFAGIPAFPVAKYQEIGLYVPTPTTPAKAQPQFLFIYQQNQAKTSAEGRGEDVRRADVDPYGKWMLLEWEFSDAPTTTRIWLDGKPVMAKEGEHDVDVFSYNWPRGAPETRNLAGGYSEGGFGARSWAPAVTKDFDIFYDDIAIGTKRIGPAK